MSAPESMQSFVAALRLLCVRATGAALIR